MTRVDKGIILVLGSPNSDEGELFSIAKERCDLALSEYKKRKNYKLLLTGGYGQHFNRTKIPHASYLRDYLILKGIPVNAFTEFAESSNTLEDASISKPIVVKNGFTQMLVITSDYHIDRAKKIFAREYSNSNVKIEYSVSITNEEKCEIDLISIKKHEKKAIKIITKLG